MTEAKAPPARSRLSARFRAYLFETWLGVATIYTALLYPIPGNVSPSAVATREAFGAVAWLWLAQYGLAGILLLIAVARPHIGVHAAGLVLIAGGAFVNVIAQVVVYGPFAVIGVFIQAWTIACCLWRLKRILHGERIGVFFPEGGP